MLANPLLMPIRRRAAALRRLPREDRGNIAIVTALAATVLTGVAGLAIDVGAWEVMQTRLQEAVDQSSRAATAALISGGNPSVAAKTVAASYGLVNGRNGVSIAVNWPPTNGTYQGNGMAVEVVIKEPAPQFFSRLFVN
ncbi:MAG TPA: pilus assembly protein TadG-related protein [Stellaceae bacterium]|nr:pilus assembly protein TadG-related protein [Stellaceae bacterium]